MLPGLLFSSTAVAADKPGGSSSTCPDSELFTFSQHYLNCIHGQPLIYMTTPIKLFFFPPRFPEGFLPKGGGIEATTTMSCATGPARPGWTQPQRCDWDQHWGKLSSTKEVHENMTTMQARLFPPPEQPRSVTQIPPTFLILFLVFNKKEHMAKTTQTRAWLWESQPGTIFNQRHGQTQQPVSSLLTCAMHTFRCLTFSLS